MSSLGQRQPTQPQWRVLLRALREASGVTQAGWATQLGYGLRTIQRWEHGDLAPDDRAAQALLRLCAERGLFHSYGRGVLAGITVTPDWLSDVLADARIGTHAPIPPHGMDSAVSPAPGLTQPLTSFVGRERELAEIRRVLAGARLVTLTGPGGVGKTRLAIEIARAAAPYFQDGVRLVELASLSDPERVAQALASVLGVREQPDRSLLVTLTDMLRNRHLLIVLDNCEHVLSGCAEVVAALLHGCPELRFLATSRVVLGIPGEHRWPVPGLSLPAPMSDRTPEAVERSEAVQLFVQRARAAVPGFTLSSETFQPIVDLCLRLDGLPLVIELAAAWTRVLSAHELAQRLLAEPALLVAPGGGAPARQRSLRATLDWSYDLLADADRRVLARLSVLAGGATLDIVEAVATSGTDAGPTVLASLARLVDASLIQRLESPGVESRFRLLETVRKYARERLVASGEMDAVGQRHAIAFRDLAETARSHLTGSDQTTWLDRLERDHDNLREALSWALEHHDPELSARLTASLSLFWYHRGHIAEGCALLDAALAVPASRGSSALRVAMLQGKGLLALHHGDYSAARAAAEQGASIARDMGDATSQVEILGVLGFVARVQEDWSVARTTLGNCLTVARQSGHVRGEAISLHQLGILALEAQQDFPSAWALSEKSLTLVRQIGDHRLEGNVLIAMARVARARGDVPAARELVEQAWIAHQQVGDPGAVAILLSTRAGIAADEGHIQQAVRLASSANRVYAFLGSQEWPSIARERQSWLESARRTLTGDTFARAWSEGQRETLQATIAHAMADADA